MSERFKLFSAVYLIIEDHEGKILIERRCNTGYMDGKLQFPAGHLDGGEPATDSLAREAREELDIDINPKDLIFKHISHRPSSKENPKEYIDMFFACKKWQGQIKINEPEKCSEQLWLTPEEFINHPDSIPYVVKVIKLIEVGQVYSERA
jgi:8-oxo-dGTP diphosphatase